VSAERGHRQAGFTLIEVMVSLMIAAIVSIALSGGYLVGYRTISTEARQLAADQAVSAASLSLTRDLSSATTIGTGSITPGPTTLVVTYGLPATTVTYRIDAGNNLTRTVGGVTKVAARGMQSVTIAAGAPSCTYTVTLLPAAVGAIAAPLTVTRRVGAAGCL
jgi:prepilin-type N-terminal cleavage/methylation domain-containing protein